MFMQLIYNRRGPFEKLRNLYVELMCYIYRMYFLAPAAESVVGDDEVYLVIINDFFDGFMFFLKIY